MQHLRSPTSIARASRQHACIPLAMATAVKPRTGHTRNLHWVFKVGDRTSTCRFYIDVLGMTPLRHEEFEQGCEAACNGPYDGKWSKTMIGYGKEDDHFVLELTYNYGVKSYQLGNDYRHIVIRRKATYASAKAAGVGSPTVDPEAPTSGVAALQVTAPGGYSFILVDQDSTGPTAMTELALNVSDIKKSLAFWSDFLGFAVQQSSATEAVLSCGPGQAGLRLVQLPQGTAMDRGTAFGRVAFAAAGSVLKQLEADVLAAGYTVHTPYVSLDTPGKATVQVVILQDPDGHEICFVGDEGFKDLSQVDPAATQLLEQAMTADKSDEWMAKREKQLAEMAAKGV